MGGTLSSFKRGGHLCAVQKPNLSDRGLHGLALRVETWVVTDRMRRVLEAFHHGCARHITRKYIHRVSDGEGGDEFWVYPSTAMVLKEARLKPIMDYITERRQVFHDNFLRFSPRFAASKEWKVASHTRKFPRYHDQQWTVSTEDAEHTEQ